MAIKIGLHQLLWLGFINTAGGKNIYFQLYLKCSFRKSKMSEHMLTSFWSQKHLSKCIYIPALIAKTNSFWKLQLTAQACRREEKWISEQQGATSCVNCYSLCNQLWRLSDSSWATSSSLTGSFFPSRHKDSRDTRSGHEEPEAWIYEVKTDEEIKWSVQRLDIGADQWKSKGRRRNRAEAGW